MKFLNVWQEKITQLDSPTLYSTYTDKPQFKVIDPSVFEDECNVLMNENIQNGYSVRVK